MPRSPDDYARIATFHGRLLGIALGAFAALAASSAGVLVRLVEDADAWTVLFYRSVSFTLTVGVFVVARHRGAAFARFGDIGIPGVVVALSLGGAFLAFVLALAATNVATVVAMLGAAPVAAGLIGWLALGERPSPWSWLALVAACAGVSLVAWDGLAGGNAAGLILAALACGGYAVAVVGLRAGRRQDMAPAVCLSGVVACAASLCMLGGFAVSGNDLVVSLLLGTVQIGAQYILLSIATRFASAADVALVMILEIFLAPLWTWLVVGEAVPVMVFHGGLVIVAALVVNTLAGGVDNGRAETGGGESSPTTSAAGLTPGATRPRFGTENTRRA